jgi:hypothetical protein
LAFRTLNPDYINEGETAKIGVRPEEARSGNKGDVSLGGWAQEESSREGKV